MPSPRASLLVPSPRPLLLGGLIALGALSGCSSVDSVPHTSPKATGMPYHLPSGAATLTLNFAAPNKDASAIAGPSITVSTSRYPDPSATFYLQPNDNGFFGTNNTITVANGLLTSVSTDDKGEINSAILSIVDTGIAIAKLKYGLPGAQSDTAIDRDIFLNTDKFPSPEEIAYVLSRVAGGSAAIQLYPSNPPATPQGIVQPVVGAEPFLYIRGTLIESGLDATPAIPAPDTHAAPAGPAEKIGGVYTRSLRPYLVGAELVLKTKALQDLRLERQKKAEADLIASMPKTVEAHQRDTTRKQRLDTDLQLARDMLTKLKKSRNEQVTDLLSPSLTETARNALEARRTSTHTSIDAIEKEITAIETESITLANNLSTQKKDLTENETKLLRHKEVIALYSGAGTAGFDAPEYVLRSTVSLVALPDPHSRVPVLITRAPIGNTKNTITLQEGLLTEYKSERPSSVAEFAKLPADALNKVTGSIAEIFQFRIDLNTKRKDAKESDAQLLEKMKAIEDRLKALKTPAPSPSPAPGTPAAPAPTPNDTTAGSETRPGEEGMSPAAPAS